MNVIEQMKIKNTLVNNDGKCLCDFQVSTKMVNNLLVKDTMLKELAGDPAVVTHQTKSKIEFMVRFFESKLKYKKILDVGQRSPLTQALEQHFQVKIDSTEGDLDEQFDIPGRCYDVIIYSHTIEHQLSPLYTLQCLREVLHADGTIYIVVPDREVAGLSKILWSKGHYHEIDRYRMGLLIKRAHMFIHKTHRYKSWRNPMFYTKGIRPLLRLFFEFDLVYEIKLYSRD